MVESKLTRTVEMSSVWRMSSHAALWRRHSTRMPLSGSVIRESSGRCKVCRCGRPLIFVRRVSEIVSQYPANAIGRGGWVLIGLRRPLPAALYS